MAASVTTFLMFEGKAEEAMTFYTSLFSDAEILAIERYGADGPGPEGTVRTARFSLAGRDFMCVDSYVRHDLMFTSAVSLYVECETEDEIDSLYDTLGAGGAALMPLADYGFGSKFGWVNDRFGVSWQLCLP
ncbi:MAG: VOC family protein [Nocardiopsaceae bacterium]|nr:VOC family protein [Nocardiopsaceae bacterium]